MFFYQIAEGLSGLAFSMEALYDTDTGQIFMDEGIQIRGFLFMNLPFRMRTCLNEPYAGNHKWNTDERSCCQDRILNEHDGNNCTYSNKIRD